MEQIYLLEIFVDRVTIFLTEEDEKSTATKNLIIKLTFGPKFQFIIKEPSNDEKKDDIVECDDQGRRKYTKIVRAGKSFLFPSYPDTVLTILNNFPLEIEVWNDDDKEVEIFVGIGTMHWDKKFFHMLKKTSDANKLHEPLSIKQVPPLFAECCCRQCGDIAFIIRLSALGESIITEFQELLNDPEKSFVFRTDKAPGMLKCKRVEGEDLNFCMVGSLYETTTLEDPDIVEDAQGKIEMCTQLKQCGVGTANPDYSCEHNDGSEDEPKKSYAIEKIRMEEITGPCGNFNCPLAHKVRTYIRSLTSYKKIAGNISGVKDEVSKKVCGKCVAIDDRHHRLGCPVWLEQKTKEPATGKEKCGSCISGISIGQNCEDRKSQEGSNSPKGGTKTQVSYALSVITPDFKVSKYGKDFTVQSLPDNINYSSTSLDVSTNLTDDADFEMVIDRFGCSLKERATSPDEQLIDLSKVYTYEKNYTVNNVETNLFSANNSRTGGSCSCSKQTSSQPNKKISDNNLSVRNAKKTLLSSRPPCTVSPMVYNVEGREPKRRVEVSNCTDVLDDKDCKCSPSKPAAPCNTFDCDCLTEAVNAASRKQHKSYCPMFKHKSNCPISLMNGQNEEKNAEDDEDEAETLPYGLPPVKLGPCPVMGKPCCAPDGFARMYKTGAMASLPPSYSEAGKVCCSKEFERIKKAIQEYLTVQKDNDYRCINTFNVDTERRCCDKEQVLMSLMSKSCCGSHKMSLKEKFEDKEK